MLRLWSNGAYGRLRSMRTVWSSMTSVPAYASPPSSAGRVLGLGVRVDDVVEVRLDGGGVEGRAVVEGDALLELEGVLEAVVGDLPRVGQPRLEAAVRVLDDQGVEGVPEDERRDIGGGRVEVELATRDRSRWPP